MGAAAWLSGKVTLMCSSHGHLLYLEAKNVCTRHSSDRDKGEIIKECVSPDFSIANDRILFQNALSTLLTSLGVSQGQQDPGSRAKALKFCLCLSPLSLSFLSVFLWYLHGQTTSIHMVTRGLPATLSLHSSDKKSPRRAFLPSFFGKSPEPSLRLNLSCSPIPEAIVAAQQVVYTGWSSRVMSPPLVLGVRQTKWAESWGWVNVQNKIKVQFPQEQGMDAGQTDRRKWSTNMCCNVNQKNQSEVTQSCLTLCSPMDCGPPGSSVHGIFQARVLEWVAISFSRRSSQPRNRTQVSHIVGRCFTVWATREVLQCEGTLKTRQQVEEATSCVISSLWNIQNR